MAREVLYYWEAWKGVTVVVIVVVFVCSMLGMERVCFAMGEREGEGDYLHRWIGWVM